MSNKLADIDGVIKKLTEEKNQILSSLKTGMVIRFPGRDVYYNRIFSESDSADGCPIDPDPKKLRELVFVVEVDNNKIKLLHSGGKIANLGYSIGERTEMSRDAALLLIDNLGGQVLSKDISDILNKF